MQTIIEVKEWSDSQTKYTKCVMVHADLLDTTNLVEIFCKNKNISFLNESLKKTIISNKSNDFVNYLSNIGFKKLKTTEVLFND